MRLPALRDFVNAGDLPSLWTSAHHLALFLIRLDRTDAATAVWRKLGPRQAFTAPYRRDQLTRQLGAPGESTMSDREFTKYLKDLVDELDAASAASPAS